MQVRDLEKDQQKAREKEVKRREKLLEKERAEHEEAIKMKVEMEAYELQVGVWGVWGRGEGVEDAGSRSVGDG